MGYGVYEDPWHPGRWAGYDVPAVCDMRDCNEKIDHGMAYLCEEHWKYTYKLNGVEVAPTDEWDEEIEGEEKGCLFYFCDEHMAQDGDHHKAVAKFDVPQWSWWILNHHSWETWRERNAAEVEWHRKNIEGFEPDEELLETLATAS